MMMMNHHQAPSAAMTVIPRMTTSGLRSVNPAVSDSLAVAADLGKTRARFTNLIAEPDAGEDVVTEAVNDTLKAIAASLLMEQVLAPRFEFKPKNPNDGPTPGFDYQSAPSNLVGQRPYPLLQIERHRAWCFKQHGGCAQQADVGLLRQGWHGFHTRRRRAISPRFAISTAPNMAFNPARPTRTKGPQLPLLRHL